MKFPLSEGLPGPTEVLVTPSIKANASVGHISKNTPPPPPPPSGKCPNLSRFFYVCAPLKLKVKSKFKFSNLGRPIAPPPFEKCLNLIVHEKKCPKQFGQAQNPTPPFWAMPKFKQFFMCILPKTVFYVRFYNFFI